VRVPNEISYRAARFGKNAVRPAAIARSGSSTSVTALPPPVHPTQQSKVEGGEHGHADRALSSCAVTTTSPESAFAITNGVLKTNDVRVKYDSGVTETIPAPPWRPARKAVAGKQPLSAERVFSTALRIVDREGLDALSMRRVAQELGTGPASLYAYVTSKEELLEQLLDQVVGEVVLPEVDPARWADQLKELHRGHWTVLRAHRDLARAAYATIPVGPNALRVTECCLALLRAGGVPDVYAAWAVDKLAMLVVSDLVEAEAYRAKRHEPDEDSQPHLDELRDYFASLPVDRFPNLVAMSATMFAGRSDERFLFGLNLFVDGLSTLTKSAT
jgi:AcrR family transcriptional regulator